jgi:small-conductance mechanosensitive channel
MSYDEVVQSASTVTGIPADSLPGRAIALLLAVVVAGVVEHFVVRAVRHVTDHLDAPSASIFANVARGLVWALALLSVLEPVFGVSPSAFVAALGVTGIAISFGLQDTVSNLVAGFVLMVGKVVQPGDRVRIEELEGTVVDVTWRNTVVRDRDGNEEVIPNSVLNTTSLMRLTDAVASTVLVSVTVAPGADLDEVTVDICVAAHRGLAGDLDPTVETGVFFTALGPAGTRCDVALHVRDGVSACVASDALVRELAGSPWLAHVPTALD